MAVNTVVARSRALFAPQRICHATYKYNHAIARRHLQISSKPRHLSTSTIPGKNQESTFDYIIVGAGSAGCVLANRLSAESSNSVLLIEAGGRDNSWRFQMPAALMYTLKDPVVNWCYYTVPQQHADHRQMYWPRAKVWGGCSSHNAMVYVRGHAHDYDRWESQGAEGWSYADCLPYFQRSETFQPGADDYRGGEGPLGVSRGQMANPLFSAFIESGKSLGYPYTPDSNGFQQEGFGPYDMTIKDGQRSSTSQAYLVPALCRPNLHTRNRVITNRIIFEGKRAVGVEIWEHGTLKKVYAEREVILSAGAINSPQLLMLSGIGDADKLRKLDIPVVQHLPGVGQNLQDHLDYYFQFACTQPITLYKYQWKFPWHMVNAGLQWFLSKSGDAATTHLHAGAFIRSKPGLTHPDTQYHFLPSVVVDHGQTMGKCHAYQIHVSPLRPTSAGSLDVCSRDPEVAPKIDANYLATETDREDFRQMLRLTREVMMGKPFEPFRGAELQPGTEVQSDAELDRSIRQQCDSAYHPSCTAKMGRSTDGMAVTSPQCQVYGTENLRVVDASIMPSIISGNLNAPTVMIGEKAADIIMDKLPLPQSTAPVWRPVTLDTQR